MIEKTKLSWNEFSELPDAEDVNTDTGALVPMGADDKMLIILSNSGDAETDVTVKAGDGIQATEDITVTVPEGKEVAVSVESGKFLITKGENKGNVLVTCESAGVKARAIELP